MKIQILQKRLSITVFIDLAKDFGTSILLIMLLTLFVFRELTNKLIKSYLEDLKQLATIRRCSKLV